MKSLPLKTSAWLLFLVLTASAVQGATIDVDGTTCTLADAIVAANTDTATGGCPQGDTGLDTIVLDADVTLTAVNGLSTTYDGLAGGLPDITDDLTITAGLGAIIQRDPTFTCDAATADPVFRFFSLEAGTLILDGLTLQNGCAVAATIEGGGIRTSADTVLTLNGVTVADSTAISTSTDIDGGFLYPLGDELNMIDSVVTGYTAEANTSVDGGFIRVNEQGTTVTIQDSEFSDFEVTGLNSTVEGGAIFCRGTLNIFDTTFSGFTVATGDATVFGGVLNQRSNRPSRLERVTVTDIHATSGLDLTGGFIYSLDTDMAVQGLVVSEIQASAIRNCEGAGINGRGGMIEGLLVEDVFCEADIDVEGAAVWLSSGAVLKDCILRNNEGQYGVNGFGGAIFGDGLEAMERCAVVDNRLTPDASTVAGSAFGGGLYAEEVERMRNVTFSGNIVAGGDSDMADVDGGDALGGGLFLGNESQTESSVVAYVTVVGNQAVAGTGIGSFSGGDAKGGGLYVATNHTASLTGAILTSNTVTDGDSGIVDDEDCDSDGTFTSLGYNLAKNPDPSCGFSAFGDLIGINPGLYPVDDYGCDTPLLDGSCVPAAAVDQTSWAVDWGSCAEVGLIVDSRGLDRRQDIAGVPNLSDACDVGAYEARDSDGDGVTDVPDLCPDVADSDQSDGDGDQVGDACDACEGDDASGDSDADMVCDDTDVCAGFDDAVDSDIDGVPDGCDVCAGDDASGDSDADMVCDDSDVCAGSDDGLDSDTDGVPDGCDVCTGDDASGDSDGDGLCDDSDASVGDRVWLDDGNGIQDGGELGIGGVTIHLFDIADTLVDSTTTDGNGFYAFSPGPGDYYLQFVLPADMAFAPRARGMDEAADSDPNVDSGATSVFSLSAGQADVGRDAGLEPAVIGNQVWLDANADGRRQPGELGLTGITVRLLDAGDNEIASTVTGVAGIYGFSGVATGLYRIEVTLPADAVFSTLDVGSDELIDSDVDPSTGQSELFEYTADSASRHWDAGLQILPLFADGFESGDTSAWTSSAP